MTAHDLALDYFQNQFDKPTSLEVGRSVLLAVPSAVRDWKPA